MWLSVCWVHLSGMINYIRQSRIGGMGDHRAQSGSTGGHRWPFGVHIHIGSLETKGHSGCAKLVKAGLQLAAAGL
jgi:hypothetical protein